MVGTEVVAMLGGSLRNGLVGGAGKCESDFPGDLALVARFLVVRVGLVGSWIVDLLSVAGWLRLVRGFVDLGEACGLAFGLVEDDGDLGVFVSLVPEEDLGSWVALGVVVRRADGLGVSLPDFFGGVDGGLVGVEVLDGVIVGALVSGLTSKISSPESESMFSKVTLGLGEEDRSFMDMEGVLARGLESGSGRA